MKKERIKILGSGVDAVTQKEALEDIRLFLSSASGHHAVTFNSEMAVRGAEDREFCDIVEAADLVVADGMGILAAASYLRKKTGNPICDLARLVSMPFYELFFPGRIKDVLPEKISGIDLIDAICMSDFILGKKIYLLGAGEGVAKKAGKELEEKYPDIVIVGAEAGIWKDIAKQDDMDLISRIAAASPDILFVALGSPKQEKWIAANLARLPSVRLAMGVGGSFDVISGKARRAPEIFQRHGMEWLWRLIREPRRLRRIYNATFRFARLIFCDKADKITR